MTLDGLISNIHLHQPDTVLDDRPVTWLYFWRSAIFVMAGMQWKRIFSLDCWNYNIRRHWTSPSPLSSSSSSLRVLWFFEEHNNHLQLLSPCVEFLVRIYFWEFSSQLITAGTLVSSSVNGDIAIQLEWSNFDPSQNLNPLTDYDETLHNGLYPRDEHVTQNLCQSTVRESLAKYVKYKAFLFYF